MHFHSINKTPNRNLVINFQYIKTAKKSTISITIDWKIVIINGFNMTICIFYRNIIHSYNSGGAKEQVSVFGVFLQVTPILAGVKIPHPQDPPIVRQPSPFLTTFF